MVFYYFQIFKKLRLDVNVHEANFTSCASIDLTRGKWRKTAAEIERGHNFFVMKSYKTWSHTLAREQMT